MTFFHSPHRDKQEQASSPDQQSSESPEKSEQQSAPAERPEDSYAAVPAEETPGSATDDSGEEAEKQEQLSQTARRSDAITQPLHPLLSEHEPPSAAPEQTAPAGQTLPDDRLPKRPKQTQILTPFEEDAPDEPDAPDDSPQKRPKQTQILTPFEEDAPDEPDVPDVDLDDETQQTRQPVSSEDFNKPDADLDDQAQQPAEPATSEEFAVRHRQAFSGYNGFDDTQMLDPEQIPMLTTHRSVQTLTAAARRDIGRVRQSNQDSVLSLLTYLPRESTDMPLGLFVVADGMGGHEGGEIASRLAIRTIMQEVFTQLVMPTLDDAMIEAIQPMLISAVQEANQVIWDHAQMMGSDMGTTCTAVLLLGRAFYIAHVGDSRAYLYEPGGLRALTNDHSTVGRLIELGQLDPSKAHDHPLRNQLYRTIGQQPEVEVDFIYQPIENSTHLIICSDGLWGMVSEDHIKEALTRSPWPQDVCDELIALANLAGGDDNISVVVVTLPVTERLHS